VKFVGASLVLSLSAIACSRCPPRSLPLTVTPATSAATSVESELEPYLPNGCMHGPHDVRSWKRVDPSSVPTVQHFALNYSPCTWSLALLDGVPLATQHHDLPAELPPTFHAITNRGSPRMVGQARSGLLVGYNHGEWGGALLWCSEDGSVRRELLDDNIVEIVPTTEGFIVLAGLTHLGGDRGRVVELVDEGTGFHVGRMTELGGAPRAAAMEPSGATLVATTRGLVRLTPEFHVHRLIDTDWGMLYPVSIVVDGSATVYVGMRGIVAELKMNTDPPAEAWLFPI
jgi:hypothetical protein